jgi:hypothetical protein
VRTIQYCIRLAIVLILTLAFYLGAALLFHQAVQLPALITLLIVGIGAERLWTLLEWIGPVVGTMNKKKQEQERNQAIDFLLDCSLRYNSPLVIAAIHSKKRLLLHVVQRYLRKSDIVLRSAPGYLLILMPYTDLDQAAIPLNRIARQLPIKDIVQADVNMLQALVEKLRTHTGRDASSITTRDLRNMCLQAFDVMLANIKSSKAQHERLVIHNLYERGTPDALLNWVEMLASSEPEEADALPGTNDESATAAPLPM